MVCAPPLDVMDTAPAEIMGAKLATMPPYGFVASTVEVSVAAIDILPTVDVNVPVFIMNVL